MNPEELKEALAAKMRAKAAKLPAVFSGESRPTWDSVLNGFVMVNQPLEGLTHYMYSDSLGFVTTGMGNLIDSDARGADGRHAAGSLDAYGPALALPWMNADGSAANQAEIIAEWQLVKSSYPGVQSTGDGAITQLRLSDDAVQNLVLQRVYANEASLVEGFPLFGNMVADGQMVLHGMAWAMGSGFWKTFKQFTAAVNAEDWVTAKAQGGFVGESPQRKTAHDKLFDNAAAVIANNLDRSVLYYPNDAGSGGGSGHSLLGSLATVALVLGAATGAAVFRHEIASGVKQVWHGGKQVVTGTLESAKKVVT